MKKVKKHIALFLAFLMALSLLPGSVLAEAAEETYTLLCEPNIAGGFKAKTYENVAAVWEDVYYDPISGQILENIKSNWDKGYRKPMHLMAADKSGVHAVSDWYREITGLSASGFAAAQNFDGKCGVINASGKTVVDFIYDGVYMPTDDGYAVAHISRTGDFLLDLNNDIVLRLPHSGSAYNNGLLKSDSRYYDIDGNNAFTTTYFSTGIFNNGYAVVEDREHNNLIISTTGAVMVNDKDREFSIVSWAVVSAEGLVPVYLYDKDDKEHTRIRGFGYIDLNGNVVLPKGTDEYYDSAYNFHNGYAVSSSKNALLIDSSGACVIPHIREYRYTEFSDVSNTGIVWCEKNRNTIAAVYQVESHGSQNNQPTIQPDVQTTSDEYIYNFPESNDNLDLPTENLDNVSGEWSAVDAVKDLVNRMTEEEKTSPICIDLATLYAETAVAKAASRVIEGNDILVDAATVAELGNIAAQTSAAVETTLDNGGVTTARYLSTTVTLATDETDITVRIDPDVLTTEVDKVRVETPSYALTFKLSDLAPDLTQPLTFTAKSSAAGSTTPSAAVSSFSGNTDDQSFTAISMSILANAAVPAVEIDMPGGKTTNSITVSLPSDSGDTTYQAVASADGSATTSKYNPATTQMDGKVNTSGKYTVMTNEKDFTDISNKSKEMQDAIRYLASKGIISGTTATTFNPDGSINRAEIATLLVKALGKLDTSATTSFSDVTKGNWFYAAAASSQRHKLINGYEDNTFRGTTSINKVQIVAVSSRVLTSEMNYKVPSNPSAYLSKYKDTVANWAQSEVALATRENLVVYRTDGTFSGDKNMTRGDAAIIIYRLFQRIW